MRRSSRRDGRRRRLRPAGADDDPGHLDDSGDSRDAGHSGDSGRSRDSGDSGESAEATDFDGSERDDGSDDRGSDDDHAACERHAVALLARREHTRMELERKLGARGYSKPLIAATLDLLEQSGLLDGQRFMESFIDSRAGRGLGPVRIRAELVQRGIPGDAAAAALGAAEHDWGAIARRARIKRFGDARPADFRERARQARFLQYRGFDASHVDAALEVDADSD